MANNVMRGRRVCDGYLVCLDLRVASYCCDTLVLKPEGNTHATLLHHPFLFTGKPTQCSSGSKKDFWRRCRGDLCSSQDIPSTHHKLLSLALHYLPFASRFPLPHFSLAILFALSFPISSSFSHLPFSSSVRLLACQFACLSRWLYLDLVTFTLKG